MHPRIQQSRLGRLLRQRYRVRWILLAGALFCFIQAFTIYGLLGARSTTVIPLPCGANEPVTLSPHRVSASYLAEMTRYLTVLRFNYTPATIEHQMQWVLQYTDGRCYGQLKEQLAEEIDLSHAEDISVSFSPVETRVDASHWTVWVDGDLVETVGKIPLGARRMTAVVQYRYVNGQLRLLSLKEVKEAGAVSHSTPQEEGGHA